MKMNLAEMTGTFVLVFIGAGAIAIDLPHLQVSMAFGGIVTLMILCFGRTSGAHINPAVTLAFYLITKDRKILFFIPFQLIGGLLAAIILWLLLPSNETYGETFPTGSMLESFAIEVLITWLLVFSILQSIKTENLLLIAVIVGCVVFLAAYFAGPFTGASMNPARSFGPAIVSGNIGVLWIYFLAPIVGSILAVFVNLFFEKRNRLNYSS